MAEVDEPGIGKGLHRTGVDLAMGDMAVAMSGGNGGQAGAVLGARIQRVQVTHQHGQAAGPPPDEPAGFAEPAAPASFLVRTVGTLPIVCDKGMKDRSILKQGADGSGMFTLSEAVANDHYTLTRRQEYAWGPGDWKADRRGLPDTVILKVVTNESTAANLLISKQANAVQVVGPDRQRLQAAELFPRQVEAPLGELCSTTRPGCQAPTSRSARPSSRR